MDRLADRHDAPHVRGVDLERHVGPLRQRAEQADGVAGLRVRRAGSRQRQGLEPEDLLASEVERLTRRDQYGEAGVPAQQRRELGGRLDDVLEVVEHEQHPPAVEGRVEPLARTGPFGCTDSGGHGVEHQAMVREGTELHEVDAVLEGGVTGRRGGDLERQARLADAPDADYRDEAGAGGQQVAEGDDLEVAAHQRGERRREGRRHRRPGGARERRPGGFGVVVQDDAQLAAQRRRLRRAVVVPCHEQPVEAQQQVRFDVGRVSVRPRRQSAGLGEGAACGQPLGLLDRPQLHPVRQVLARRVDPVLQLGAHLLEVEAREERAFVESCRSRGLAAVQRLQQLHRVAGGARGERGGVGHHGPVDQAPGGGRPDLRQGDAEAVQRSAGLGPEELGEVMPVLRALDRQVGEQQ